MYTKKRETDSKGKQFAQNVLRGLTEEEIRLCIRVFDKICNNAEEQLKNDKENES